MRHTRRDLRERKWSSPAKTLVRRLRVAASAGVRWVLEGAEDSDGNVETDEVEVFPGVGFYSRPKAGHRVEAIQVKVGGESGHPVIVATRNQDGIKLLGNLAEDETAIFTSRLVIRLKADEIIEVGSIGGPVAPLATKADLDALALVVNTHTHLYLAGPPGTAVPSATALPQATPSSGTQKLRAE